MLVTVLCFPVSTERRITSVNTGGFSNMDVPFWALTRSVKDFFLKLRHNNHTAVIEDAK